MLGVDLVSREKGLSKNQNTRIEGFFFFFFFGNYMDTLCIHLDGMDLVGRSRVFNVFTPVEICIQIHFIRSTFSAVLSIVGLPLARSSFITALFVNHVTSSL